MKTYLSLVIILNTIFFVPARAQRIIDSCDTVALKGYIIKQYKKNDIDEIKKHPSKHYIDIYERTYFMPTEHDILRKEVVDSINVFNPNGVYFPPSKLTSNLIRKFCGDVKPYTSIRPSGQMLLNLLFQIGGRQSEFLYKIYYSECKAVKSKIVNSSFHAFELNIPFNKDSKFIVCYFIYRDIILEEIDQINDVNFLRVQ